MWCHHNTRYTLVSSRLDYVNSILSGSPLKHTPRLQRAQHALARVVSQERSRARSAPLMQQLHWLPIEWRIRFKLATLTYKALQTGRPPYLADLIQFHTTPKSTRSSSSQLLFIPCHSLSFGSRAFRVSAPKVWTTLPLHIRQSQSLSTFRRYLKTHYFKLAYPATWRPLRAPSRSRKPLRLAYDPLRLASQLKPASRGFYGGGVSYGGLRQIAEFLLRH